jgi:hypothetical protein
LRLSSLLLGGAEPMPTRERVLLTGGPIIEPLFVDVDRDVAEHVVPYGSGTPKELRGRRFERTDRFESGLAVFEHRGRKVYQV